MDAYAEELLPRMLAPSSIAAQPAVADHVLQMMRSTSALGAAAALRGRAQRPNYVDLLSHVAVPTEVVVGREDDFTRVADAELISARIPHARLHVIDGAGHMPNLEQPAAFNAILEGLLASTYPRRRQADEPRATPGRREDG